MQRILSYLKSLRASKPKKNLPAAFRREAQGNKSVSRTWLLAYPIALGMFYLAKQDLDKRRIRVIKERGVYGEAALKSD